MGAQVRVTGESSSFHVLGRVLDFKPREDLQGTTITKQEDFLFSITLGRVLTCQHIYALKFQERRRKVTLGHHPNASHC